MIRINTVQEPDCVAVIIDGELSPAELPEVRRVRASLSGTVMLQLSGLSVCSDEGVRELREWLASGASLRDADLFLRMVLGGTHNRDEAGAR